MLTNQSPLLLAHTPTHTKRKREEGKVERRKKKIIYHQNTSSVTVLQRYREEGRACRGSASKSNTSKVHHTVLYSGISTRSSGRGFGFNQTCVPCSYAYFTYIHTLCIYMDLSFCLSICVCVLTAILRTPPSTSLRARAKPGCAFIPEAASCLGHPTR